ncbi:MAG TPA: IS200/IS605 family transposase [Pyrinomonadaceae bacterium]|jgi:REP element-mobilizing transposase RayT
MPYVKVWTTKKRKPLLTDTIRARIFDHIRQNAKAKGIFIDHINGYREHVHVLISLGTDQKISEIVKLLKGESSHWINQEEFTQTKFQWQHEYFAVGVSESVVDKVRSYIRRQEEHHARQTFEDEFDAMITKFGFTRHADDEE